jgi:hypothetical protein
MMVVCHVFMFSLAGIYALSLCRNFIDFKPLFLQTGIGKRAGCIYEAIINLLLEDEDNTRKQKTGK